MPFPPDVKAQALIDSGRCCCICRKNSGVNIECHHIVPEADGGSDLLENCIPLCFDCHADVQHYNVRHPKGNKFTPEELRGHRDRWHEKRMATGAPDASETVITKDDVLTAFREIDDFPEDHITSQLGELRATLIRNGVVTRRQLFELVFSAPILDQIRSLYVELLLRPKDKTLDPMAVAVWGAALYTYGLRKELIDQIVWQLRQSPEYKEKHQ